MNATETIERTLGQAEFRRVDAELGDRGRRAQRGVHTYLERIDADTVALTYRGTAVLTFHRDGRVIARTGGWFTATTKERMNRQSVCNVWQDRGAWYVGWNVYDAETGAWGPGVKVPFEDGMDLGALR